MPGLIPSEAVRRLRLFHDQYHQLDHRRKVLDAVQVVFGIAPTPFPELDKTGEVIHGIATLIRLTNQSGFGFKLGNKFQIMSNVCIAVKVRRR